jgi:hypothetical protein
MDARVLLERSSRMPAHDTGKESGDDSVPLATGRSFVEPDDVDPALRIPGRLAAAVRRRAAAEGRAAVARLDDRALGLRIEVAPIRLDQSFDLAAMDEKDAHHRTPFHDVPVQELPLRALGQVVGPRPRAVSRRDENDALAVATRGQIDGGNALRPARRPPLEIVRNRRLSSYAAGAEIERKTSIVTLRSS